jgi:hypothetical protein
MRREAKSAFYDSPKRAEYRRLKAADEKGARDAREWEAAQAEKQMLDNLADRLKGSEWEKLGEGQVGRTPTYKKTIVNKKFGSTSPIKWCF